MGKLAARRADCAPLAGNSTLDRSSMAGRRRHATTRSATTRLDRAAVRRASSMRTRCRREDRARPRRHRRPLHGSQEGRFFHGYYGCYCYLPLYVSVAITCWLPSCGGRTSTPAPARSRRWRGWWARSGHARRSCGSSWATAASHGTGPWPRPSSVGSTMSSAWPATPAWSARSPPSLPPRRPGRGPASQPAASRTSAIDPRQLELRAPGGRQSRAAGRRCRRAQPRPALRGDRPRRRGLAAAGTLRQLSAPAADGDRIKECQHDLFADRTSTRPCGHQLRLWFASMAYVLLAALRRIALPAPGLPRPRRATSASSC